MEINFVKQKNNLIVVLQGDVDDHNAEMIRQAVDAMYLKNKAKNIIFDFSHVGFMDSSGIGMIIGRYRLTLNNGGTTMISGLRPDAMRIFNLSGLKRIIKSTDSVDEALKSI